MGFLVGSCSSSFMCSPWPLHLQLQQPPLLFTSQRTKKGKRAVLASLREESPPNGMICRKRLILFMGFAMTPYISLKGQAAEQHSTEDTSLVDQQQKLDVNQMLSLVNMIGVLGSAVLAPLYLFAKKEKEASEAVLESMNVKLKEKQTAIGFLEKKYESDLANAKESQKMVLGKANEEKQKLLSQIEKVNEIISSLSEEIKAEKRIAEELGSFVERLESNLEKAIGEKVELQQQLESKCNSMELLEERVRLLSSEINDKEAITQNIGSELVEKERELAELSSSYEEARDEVAGLKQEIEELKSADSEKRKELESKNSLLNDLNRELASSQAEIDESRKNLDTLLKEYEDYKSSAEIEAASNANLLEEREKIVLDLEDQLAVALDDLNNHRDLVTNSAKERDDLAALLNTELENVKNLEHQVKITQDSLDKSTAVALDLAKQLQLSKNLNSRLDADATKMRDEYNKARVSLENDIAETKQEAEVLADELRWVKEQVRSSELELQNLSEELSAVVEKRDILEKELCVARTASDKASLDLQKETKLVSSLRRELSDFETRLSDEKAAKTTLETHLELVKQSLDEMNHYVSTLSEELEFAKSQISSSKDEKEALQKALDQQRKLYQEAKENLEEAHSVVMRIGKDRELLDLRGKKLEDELASAKGEILRLRSELSSSTDQQIEDENSSKTSVPARRVVRRKKVTASQLEGS